MASTSDLISDVQQENSGEESNDGAEEAAAIAAIVDRIAQGVFPPVLASEQTSMSEASASDILTWVQTVHHVSIES